MKSILAFSLLGLAALVFPSPAAVTFDDCYKIDDIKLPEGVPPEVGGLDFAPDGTLFIVLRRGDVFRATPTADPAAFDWQLFATGFHNGAGIDAVSASKVRVSQMAEMTEAEDTDGDGAADRYTVFADGWGLSGNYHETNTLTGDGDGGYFLAIGTASHNGPVFRHTLGEFSDAGRRGRNFAAVKWRGWVLHTDQNGEITPFASGFRMHNGIYRDPDDNLWATDNQGDWKAATPLYHIEEGNFYGHPSSLVWDPDFTKSDDPLAYYRDHLDEYNEDRTPPAVILPHMELNRSAGEPVEIPRDGSFGPFAGQLLIPDNNGTRISRVILEKVGGRFQGAATQFIDGRGLRSGNHRTRFSPDGTQLYIGQTVRGWGSPAEGLQRVTWLGEVPFDVERMEITPKGFRLTFTRDVPASLKEPAAWKLESFTYQPTWAYGSDPENRREHQPALVSVSDPKIVEIQLDDLEAGRVYALSLPESESEDGSPLLHRRLYYTANQLP